MNKIALAVACLLVFEAPASECAEIELQCDLSLQLEDVKGIAKEAGKRMLEIRDSGQLASQDVVLQNGKKVRQTNADIAAGQYIIDELSKKYPSYGLISQDQMGEDPNWHKKSSIWLINSIDGTKEFESEQEDFHVQIGLLTGNEPVMGVSYYPASDMYVWAVKGQGAWMEKEGMKQRLSALPCGEKIVLKSSSHKTIQTYFEQWGWVSAKVDEEPLSSTSRLLKIIQGKASLYISLGASPRGTEKKGGVWNYGANVVIASEAGVSLTTLDGRPLDLRQPDALLTGGVLLTSDPAAYKAVTATDWQ